MSHLQRISCILGAVLLGAAAVLLSQKDDAGSAVRRGRRKLAGDVPVDKLAEDLKSAWAIYHTP